MLKWFETVESLKNDLRLTSTTYRNNVNVDMLNNNKTMTISSSIKL